MSIPQNIVTKERQHCDQVITSREERLSAGSSTRTSSTTRTHAHAREEALSQLRTEYVEAVGHEMPPILERYVVQLMRDGMEPGAISAAIEATAWAPRPSAQYCRAVLARYEVQGLLTAMDVRKDEYRRSQDTWFDRR